MKTFNPPLRTLLGPGPSNVHPRILSAMARPTIGHMDSVFIDMIEEIKYGLKYAFKTENTLTMAVSAPGSAGMETCFANLVEPGDKVIVCINGVFGMRMYENIIRFGGKAIKVNDTWGQAVDIAKVENAIKENPSAKILSFVHAETSTGAKSDVEKLCLLADKYGLISIVDAVTSLAGNQLYVDKWGVDAIYSGTQKCLSAMPGISPISFNEKAIKKIKNRKTTISSWFLDLNLVMSYWGNNSNRVYHHTAPVNSLYGLHEALLMLMEEGLENSWQRHIDNHNLLKEGLAKLGIKFVVEEKSRLAQLNSVWVPENAQDLTVRNKLLNDYNIEIGAGLGEFATKIWRIGLMGNSSRAENVLLLLSAMENILKK